MIDWQSACEALWGDEWIAPLSEVLSVNRRTVERWRSGEVSIPLHIADDLVRLPRIGEAQRAYGDVLRRMANGEGLDEIEDWVSHYRRATKRAQADIGRYNSIAVLARSQRD